MKIVYKIVNVEILNEESLNKIGMDGWLLCYMDNSKMIFHKTVNKCVGIPSKKQLMKRASIGSVKSGKKSN